MNQPARQVEVQSAITIFWDVEGKIRFQIQGMIDRPIVNMLLETARQDIIKHLEKQAEARRTGGDIIVAPPGMKFARNDRPAE